MTLQEVIREEPLDARRKLLSGIIARMLKDGDSPDEIGDWVVRYIDDMMAVVVKLQVVANRIHGEAKV